MINLAPKLGSCSLTVPKAYFVTTTLADVHKDKENTIQLSGRTLFLNGECIGELQLELTDFDHYEVWIIFPNTKDVNRFFRPSANSNTILLTERCDQYCLMCSQPPKAKDYLHFDLYHSALALIKEPTVIGISGGEPTLYKEALFDFLIEAIARFPDVKFHILTNGQHFSDVDTKKLAKLRKHVIWAIPIYSSHADEHDKIVGKRGAFKGLLANLTILAKASARVELRTVVLRENIFSLGRLALFISTIFPWSDSWSIMQLEKIGFAKIDWKLKFYDTSSDFTLVASALDVCIANDVNVNLYNFPRCTVPHKYRPMAVASISDWKVKFFDNCKKCSEKNICSGVFEWYDLDVGYKNIGPIV